MQKLEDELPHIAPLDIEDVPDSLKQLLAPDRPNTIALLFGHAETNWPRLADLLLSILGEQQLESSLRELAILRVANLRGAVYEWEQHVGISQAAGVRPEQIEAIAEGRLDADCFGETERLVLEATTRLALDATLEPELTQRLVQALSPREVVELLLTAGVYEALAKLMNALGLESEGPITAEFAEAVNRGAVSR
jgi:alkylhydroperoxidase family enzyme